MDRHRMMREQDEPAVHCLRVVMAAIVAALGGCGGGSGKTAGPTDGGIDEAGKQNEADEAFAAELCEAMMPCCATNGLTANVAMCKASVRKMPHSRDSHVQAACLEELRQLSGSRACMPDIVEFGDMCARLINEPGGSLAEGEACSSRAECASTPQAYTECMSSRCMTFAIGEEGDSPCLGVEFSDGIITVTPFKSGSTTSETHGFICPKRAGLFCDWGDNTCRRMQPGGGPCTLPDGCDSRDCQNDGTCRPLPLVGEECAVSCAGDFYCERTVCKPNLAPGSACELGVAAKCAGDCKGSNLCTGTCRDGVCSPLNLDEDGLLDIWCGVRPFAP